MLIDSYNKFGIKIEDIYFAKKILNLNTDIQRYFQFYEEINNIDIKTFNTNILDLNQDIDSIYSNFRKSIKSEINQATKKYNIKINLFNQPDKNIIDKFYEFYNNVAKIKNLSFANKEKINRLKDNILISNAIYQDNIIVWHLYIYDDKRIRLFYSCSLQTDDKELYNITSRANKLLHFEDIKFAKNITLEIFDFGGVNLIDSKVAGIDQFKLGFSKKIEKSYHFVKANSFKGKIVLFLYSLLKGKK